MKTVGIIGGSGFIGSYITQKFLEEDFDVKVSVTDIKNSKKYRHLFKLKNADNLTISGLRVEDEEDLREFVMNCTIVIHGGTPFKLEVKNPDSELFEPTIKGTENFLNVVSETVGIEKVILIASVAGWNTNFPLPAGDKSFTDTFDETCERFTSTKSHPYAQAKFIANKKVQGFIDAHPNLSFEITTVSPVAVMGIALSNREDSTSQGLQHLIKHNLAPDDFTKALYANDIPFAIVDVRDVAEAIFKVATTKGLHGKDYLLTSQTYKITDIHAMLNGREAKEKPATIYKNDLAKADLRMQFRPVSETLHEYSKH